MRIRSACFALLLAAPLFAQVKETLTVSVVEVPVTVVGRDGNALRGLTAANFEVIDDGKKRPITSFDGIDFASHDALQAISPLNPVARRNFMLVFDLAFSQPSSIVRAQDAARDFIAHSIQPRDRVAIATLDTARGFRLLTAFTTDRMLLGAAINDPKSYRSSDPLQIASHAVFDRDSDSAMPVVVDGLDMDAGSPVRQQTQIAANRSAAELAQQSERSRDDFNKHGVDREIEILAALGETLRSVSGRKQIVLLSEGFDSSLLQGRTAKSMMTQRAEQETVDTTKGEVWKVDNDTRYGSAASTSLLQQFADLCRRSDVVLHAIDIRGIRMQSSVERGTIESSNEALHALASPTGGSVFQNTNDLAAAFNTMLRQQEVVYVLGFRAPASEPGRFHTLKVKIVNVPGGAQISHRSGYYEAGAETDAERTLSTAEIIINDIPQSDLRIASVAAPFPGSGDKAQVPVIVDINGADLIAKSEDETIVADVYIYAFDSNGVVRDSLYQRLTLDANKVGEKLRAGGLKYYGTLSLAPATYAVKTLVRLPGQRKNGFARVELVVPRRNEMAMSRPLFFEDTSRWVLVKGASHDEAGPYPFTIGDSTFIPSASARNRFVVFVENVNDPNVDATPGASLVSKNGNAFVFDVAPNAKSVEVAVRGTALKAAVPVQ
jgi:VWFA-related protein